MEKLTEEDLNILHEIMQPLNVIRLSCGNLRTRILNCQCADTDYLIDKIMRIEEQMIRASRLLNELKERNEDGSGPRSES